MDLEPTAGASEVEHPCVLCQEEAFSNARPRGCAIPRAFAALVDAAEFEVVQRVLDEAAPKRGRKALQLDAGSLSADSKCCNACVSVIGKLATKVCVRVVIVSCILSFIHSVVRVGTVPCKA